MCKAKNKLVYDAIDRDRSADQLERRVSRVIKDEVVPVEVCQGAAAHAACELYQMSDH